MLCRGEPGRGEPACKCSDDDGLNDDDGGDDGGLNYDDDSHRGDTNRGLILRLMILIIMIMMKPLIILFAMIMMITMITMVRPHPQSLLSLGLRKRRGRGCPS